ncbi:hypothetical protein ACVBEG_26950 [Pseudomonas sp. GG8]
MAKPYPGQAGNGLHVHISDSPGQDAAKTFLPATTRKKAEILRDVIVRAGNLTGLDGFPLPKRKLVPSLRRAVLCTELS